MHGKWICTGPLVFSWRTFFLMRATEMTAFDWLKRTRHSRKIKNVRQVYKRFGYSTFKYLRKSYSYPASRFWTSWGNWDIPQHSTVSLRAGTPMSMLCQFQPSYIQHFTLFDISFGHLVWRWSISEESLFSLTQFQSFHFPFFHLRIVWGPFCCPRRVLAL